MQHAYADRRSSKSYETWFYCSVDRVRKLGPNGKFRYSFSLVFSPSILYECVMYANKQNLDRLKNTVQQESTRQSTIDALSTSTQNILCCKIS